MRRAMLTRERPRVHNNLRLALQKTERFAQAASAMEANSTLDLQDPLAPRVLAILLAQRVHC